MHKRLIYTSLFILLISLVSKKTMAQVGIGSTVPDTTAILDINNAAGGALRMPAAPGLMPSSPQGLSFFNTSDYALFYNEGSGYNGLTAWRYKYNGSASNNTYYNLSGNVGIGRTDPQRKLHLNGSGSAALALSSASTPLSIEFHPTTYSAGNAPFTIGFTQASSKFYINQNTSNEQVIVNVNNGGKMNVQGGIIQQNGTALVPSGLIIMWSGTTVPTGWVLCDGSSFTREDNGQSMSTPNLKGQFIVAQKASDSDFSFVGKTGGEETVTLTVAQIPLHSHNNVQGLTESGGNHNHILKTYGVDGFSSSSDQDRSDECIYRINSTQFNDRTTATSGSHSHETNNQGGGEAHENRPPYYVLAFIMKK